MTQPKIDHQEAVRADSIVPLVLDGVSCYAFNVKPGDVQQFDQGEGNRGSNGQFNERAEIAYAPAQGTLKHTSPVNVREGMLQTYDIDFRFKAGFPPHDAAKHEWAVLAQFHPQDDHKAGTPNGFGGATVHNGEITFDDPMGSGSYFARIPIKPDTWIRVRMVVKWSSGTDGYAKIVDRATGALVGRYAGPTIAPGEFKYLKQGYYRAGGLPEGTVYQSSPGGPLIDIREGDLTLAAPTPTPTPTPTPVAPAAFDPSKPSVNPNAGAALAMSVVEQADAVIAVMTKIRKDAQALLDKGGFKP